MIHTAEPMASLVCECLRGSKVRVRLAGTRVLFSLVSFLAEQSAIPLINYRKPRTNDRQGLSVCCLCYRTTEQQPGSGEGQMSGDRLSTCLGSTFAFAFPDP